MNILFITDAFLPHAGGARVYYYNLYKRLAEKYGHEIVIVTKKVPGWEEFDRRELPATMRIIRKAKPLTTWKYYELPKLVFPLWECLRVLRSRHIDLVHFGDLYPPGVISLWLKRMFGLPYLAYCHGDEMAQTERYRYQPIVRDQILRSAAAIVTANRFARNKVHDVGISEEKIHTITPGVDLDRFRPLPPNPELVRRYGLDGKIVLLTAARLVPKKGHDTVIRAVAKLAREIPSLRYLIAGQGAERARLEQLVREAGIGNIVVFAGDVPNNRLGEIYNLCDIFVMANREAANADIETFGMVFVEANATGKPVIGGRSGGAIEAVEEGRTGLLVAPDNIEELAGAIRTLVENKHLRQTLGENGLRRARDEFNWDTRCDSLHKLNCDLLKQARLSSECI